MIMRTPPQRPAIQTQMTALARTEARRVRAAQRGHTFVEIVLVTAIIGILVALLLPAVQAAREAARRFRCSNNLEQLIVAVHSYELYHSVYPPGTINNSAPIRSVPDGYHHNWIIQTLPFLEQTNTYRHIDRTLGVYAAANAPVRAMFLEVLACPSQWRHSRGYSGYAGVHHDLEGPIDRDNHGAFVLNRSIEYFDIEDGTSQTFFIGEKPSFPGDLGWMSGTRATLRNTGVSMNHRAVWRHKPGPAGMPAGMEGQTNWPVDTLPPDEVIFQYLYGSRRPITRYDQLQLERNWDAVGGAEMAMGIGRGDESPLETAETPQDELPASAALAVGGFGSEHPGGAQFAFGDGSIRFVSEVIDPTIYSRLGHRADQKLIRGELSY